MTDRKIKLFSRALSRAAHDTNESLERGFKILGYSSGMLDSIASHMLAIKPMGDI